MKGSPVTSRRGFTLMEVVVTLLIMSGIMVTIAQILTAARNSRDVIHNMQEAHLAGPAILDRIERDLRAVHTYNRDRFEWIRVTNRVVGGLDADSIDFVTSTNGLVIQEQFREDRFVRADTNETGYRLRLNPDYDDFLEIWRREDFGIDDEPFDGGAFSFLHDRVKGFDIQVFDEDGPEAEPLEFWNTGDDDEQVGFPARVEIELTLELAPRLIRESLIRTRRTVTYRRVIRFPETLRTQTELQPVPTIPNVPSPNVPESEPASGAGTGGPGPGFGGGTSSTSGTGNPFGG